MDRGSGGRTYDAPQRRLDHDDFGLNQSKIMNVIDCKNKERNTLLSSRSLRKLNCAGKAAQRPGFPHPALGKLPSTRNR
jgi:hypothetical protein